VFTNHSADDWVRVWIPYLMGAGANSWNRGASLFTLAFVFTLGKFHYAFGGVTPVGI
jgi:hypothetical protein